MRLRIATWNINSVRLRFPLVARFLKEEWPDILCLQETKSPVPNIPASRFAELGYTALIARGQPGYNGVITLARIPIEDIGSRDYCLRGDARHVTVRLRNGLEIQNFYVPSGGDIPDANANPKFAHKLAFLDEMRDLFAEETKRRDRPPAILAGDLNIAPLESDVWSHVQLRNVVSHTEPEISRLNRIMLDGGWEDVLRVRIPAPEKLFSWWSYRARDWEKSDRGRRLDHIWVTSALKDKIRDARIRKDVRGWDRPSDHAPVIAEFDT